MFKVILSERIYEEAGENAVALSLVCVSGDYDGERAEDIIKEWEESESDNPHVVRTGTALRVRN